MLGEIACPNLVAFFQVGRLAAKAKAVGTD